MKNRILVALVCLLCLSEVLIAQQFISPADGFSRRKTAYVTLDDGTELTGTIRNIDRKKGLIEEIKMDLDDGSRRKISPDDIAFAYLPPSGLDKLGRTLDFLSDATQWNSVDLDNDIISQGYAYFEKSEVRIKNKTRVLLLQLMNPTFNKGVRVYYDPFAGETASLGVGGIDVVGGLAKSYYIKKGDDIAYRVKKKDYDEEFARIFAGCDAVLSDEDAGTWNQFERHVYEYSLNCTGE